MPTSRHGGRKDIFHTFAKKVSNVIGSPHSFMMAVVVVAVWGVSGPLYGFSNTWQLVINTATTIVTFLIVFLIQNTQNRDALALHLKLDEVIRALEGARNKLLDLENCTEEELKDLQEQFRKLSLAKVSRPR